MRTFKSCSIIFTWIAACAWPLTAAAQQGTVDAIPPQLEKLEEGEAPPGTARGPEENVRIIEKRERGQVTSIRVQSGNSTYYVKPNSPVSSAFGSAEQNNATRAAQWQIFQFDWKREPDRAKEAAARAATIAPPPELAPPSKSQ